MAALKVSFGRHLRALRTSKGVTQEQLADEVDLTVESISNIERGKFGPKFDNLEKIAAALQVSVKELFEFEDDPE